MGRPPGTRSDGYEAKRKKLATAVFRALVADAGVSLRGMADAAGVSRPTLVHYFGNRDGAVRAALVVAGEFGRVHQDSLAHMPLTEPRADLLGALARVIDAWRQHQVGNLHYVGLQVGLQDPATAREYLSSVLDPTVDCFAALLQRMADAGHIGPCDPRQAALMLLSPCIVGLLHQDGLEGADTRPLALEPLAEATVAMFLAAHPPAAEAAAR